MAPKSVISRLPLELVERLDAFAKRAGLSRNAAVERLLTAGLAPPVVAVGTERRPIRGHQPKGDGLPHGKPPNQGSGGKKDAPPAVRVEIHVGPVAPVFGSRLKKGKAK